MKPAGNGNKKRKNQWKKRRWQWKEACTLSWTRHSQKGVQPPRWPYPGTWAGGSNPLADPTPGPSWFLSILKDGPKKHPQGWLVFITRGWNLQMGPSWLICFRKGINKKTNWPVWNFQNLRRTLVFSIWDTFSKRGKGLCSRTQFEDGRVGALGWKHHNCSSLRPSRFLHSPAFFRPSR